MKKDKQQSPVKTARKAIQESLIKTLKNIAGQLQKQGIRTDIAFEKESKKLAKKITKGAKVDQPEPVKEAASATETKTPAKEVKTPVKKVEIPAKETAPASAMGAAPAPAKESAPAKAKPAAKPVRPKAVKVGAPAAAPGPPASAAAPKRANAAPKKAAEKN